jgi:hypothetical protein
MNPLMLLAQDGGEFVLFGGGILMLLWMLVAIGGFVLWVWALVDAIRNPLLDNTMRIVWVLVIVFTNVIGAIIYLAIGRNAPSRAAQ